VADDLDSAEAGRRVGPHHRTIVVFVFLLVVAASATFGARTVVQSESHRLLRERTAEVQLVMSNSIADIPSELVPLGAALRATGGSASTFVAVAAATATTSTAHLTYAWLRPSAAGWQVVAAEGGGLRTGQLVSGTVASTVAQAATGSEMLSTGVLGSGSDRTIGYAIGPPTAPTGTVLYRQNALGQVAAPRQAGTEPFSELDVVIYASGRPTPAQVLVTTTPHLPLSGDHRYQPLAAGASHWLLGVQARGTLVGAAAANSTWFVGSGAVFLAILVAALVEVEARRREAAMALYQGERLVAETFQRKLLPVVPELPGLDVAARYVGGSAGQQIGGDWFDVFPIGAGQIGVVIGDVVGHDVSAATAMSQLRAALRAFAWLGDPPEVVIDRLDGMVDSFGVTELATLIYGVLDPPGSDGCRSLRLSNAGHPVPVAQDPDGTVRMIEGGSSVLLGTGADLPRTKATVSITPGTTLLFYTDGLVEVPGSMLDDGLRRLRAVVEGHHPEDGAAALCDEILHSDRERGHDDIAILAIRLLPKAGLSRLSTSRDVPVPSDK
jgi:hypothetical protein